MHEGWVKEERKKNVALTGVEQVLTAPGCLHPRGFWVTTGTNQYQHKWTCTLCAERWSCETEWWRTTTAARAKAHARRYR